MKVELGAGAQARDGWLAVDLNPRNADVIADMTSLPFRRASIDELRAIDCLEHASYRDTDLVLAEWARVTKPGGRLFVQVPAADVIMQWYVRMPHKLVHRLPGDLDQSPLTGAAWRLLGGHRDGVYVDSEGDWKWNAHFAFFSADSLHRHLELTGWEVESMKTNPHPNLQCFARRR